MSDHRQDPAGEPLSDAELEAALRASLAPEPVEPPQAQLDALRAQLGTARTSQRPAQAPASPIRPRRARAPRARWLLAAAAVLLLVVGGLVGAGITSAGQEEDLLARGTPEFEATLSEGDLAVQLEGDAAPEGRIVTLRSDSLPVLPTGEYYELWFVTDGTDEPTRISAGTFHPDTEGRTLVVLHAAVDPNLVGTLEITREPGDGDPAPSGDVVLRGALDLL
ncbi:anti-sigma factor [Ruania suaedae]|uniref:anti-sigma factor n=1 Tax=Ruania suaedae TaxID=2897774 RepID=UPI001E3EEF87|nr:anti-sigma factor [Ruania suaedae]UFU02987.1 anti-sigma factor [Ruania suaedae]